MLHDLSLVYRYLVLFYWATRREKRKQEVEEIKEGATLPRAYAGTYVTSIKTNGNRGETLYMTLHTRVEERLDLGKLFLMWTSTIPSSVIRRRRFFKVTCGILVDQNIALS